MKYDINKTSLIYYYKCVKCNKNTIDGKHLCYACYSKKVSPKKPKTNYTILLIN